MASKQKIDKTKEQPIEYKVLVGEVEDQLKASYLTKENLGLHDKWRTYENYYRGKQNPPSKEDDPGSVTNIIFPIIESQVSDLVDQPLDISVIGEEPSDQEFAQDLRHVLDWVWDKNNMLSKLDVFERRRLKLGTSVFKVFFDPKVNKGKGQIVIDPVSPVCFFPDPKVKTAWQLQEADYIIHATMKSIEYIKATFGEQAEFVKAQADPSLSLEIFDGEGDTATEHGRNKVMLIERWARTKKGGLRLTQVADGVLLYDSELLPKGEGAPKKSFYRHCQYPFVVINCYPVEGCLWGMGDVELLKPTQDIINDLDDQIRLNARLTGNTQHVVGTASGINPRKWTAKAGLKIVARDPNAWKTVSPPPMPSYILNRRMEAKQESEIISGRPDVTEGRRSGGLRAASAILALQEAGNRRVKHKKIFLEDGLSQVVELCVEYIKEFFTEEHAFRIMGRRPRYIWFRGSDLLKVPKKIPVPGAEDQYQPLAGEGGEPVTKEAEFDIRISIGAGLPSNRAFLYQTILELVQYNIFTVEEARTFIKEFLGWPVIDPLEPVGNFSKMQVPLPGGAYEQPQGPGPDEMAMQTPQQVPPELLMNLVNMMGGAQR